MKTIGIIGGMGPLATADLYQKLIRFTGAQCDQAHPHVIIDSNTAIPDRSAAILRHGEDPAPEMIRSARRLQDAGAEVLLIACNTAHYWFDEIQSSVEIPILHMPRLTAAAVRRRGVRTAALLCTDGTRASGVYDAAFGTETTLLMPDAEGAAAVMSMIYDGVKAGRTEFDTEAVRRALRGLTQRGAEAFILACTELPVAFQLYSLPGECVDPTEILAREALRFCGAVPEDGNPET